MKKTKIIALTASLALSASLVLGMTACAGGVNSLYGDDYTYTAPTMTATALDALDGYTIDSVNGMDKFGIITAQKDVTPEATEAEPDPDREMEYILYDAVANKQIASTTKTEGYISSASSVYSKMTDGLYCYTETSETTGEPTYIYYGKSGSVKTTEEPATSYGSRVTFADGTALVVAEDGAVNSYTLGIQPVFTPELFTEYKDVYVQPLDSSSSYRVWNAEGEIVREVDLKKEMNKPATALDVGIWTVGNSYFEQYMVALPDDAADYDFIYGDFSGGTPASLFKMDLVTKSYNYENGKVTEHNFDEMVDDVENSSYSDDGVFLSVRTISDKQPSASTTLQYYGEDGNISVDLQDLLPGADEVTVTDEYVILKSPATISVYNTEGELLGSADARAVTFEDGYFVRSDITAGITTVYNLEGEQVFSGKETAGHGGAYGEKVYQGIANGLIYYTIETKGTATSENPFPSSTTTVYTYSEADGDKTLGEGEIVGMSSPLLQDIVYIYNSSSEDYTAYIKGYADPVATGLDSAIALDGEGASKLDDVTYALYSYTETVTSGSGETQTTERVTKYVFVTIA